MSTPEWEAAEEATRRGYDAYMDGGSVNANPFQTPAMRSWWRHGWYVANAETRSNEAQLRKMGAVEL